MRTTLKMPKVGDAADKVVIVEILAKVGDQVSEGQTLFVVETDKSQVEVPAPFARRRCGGQCRRRRRGRRPARRRWHWTPDMAREVFARDTRFGGYLDDYEPGDVFHHWPGKTITEAEDHMFCLMTMAASPIHVDRHYAETESEFGRNVVVGTFIYARCSA